VNGRSPIRLRRAERADASALLKLIVALAKFEKLVPPDAAGRKRLIKDGFGARAKYEPWLAFWDTEPNPVGYMILVDLYSSFEARPTLYLEDLFVLPEYRGRGIGNAMMRHCIELAWNRGCGRMEWTCLDWNVKAQKFYDKLGARKLSEWYLYRLTRDKIKRLVSHDED
jgi:GNAT superfamily N-acetyltransferase